ncbi:hypothetical protein IC006_0892 [Sulfuracidifex tepidarius]|uniref:Uncharacterized protein n=1 Tax=Sulfuracidifex tepidarius TaxID=1294262 RepID=A0A510E1I7_9CREN|nr:hypothetical protein IC006_0892 [Sulfuracidifex tepidarius]BBG26352.1 hypothetical protein IC007_0860 [Sulfuracidifex tepidarius]
MDKIYFITLQNEKNWAPGIPVNCYLGLERGFSLTWARDTGFLTLKALSLLLVQRFKYSTGLDLGAKRLNRLIKNIYHEAGCIKNCSEGGGKP